MEVRKLKESNRKEQRVFAREIKNKYYFQNAR